MCLRITPMLPRKTLMMLLKYRKKSRSKRRSRRLRRRNKSRSKRPIKPSKKRLKLPPS
jgi:hypothetical protein